MWPLFFNLESHLWIAYLFFINGYLLHNIFCAKSVDYSTLTQPFEAQVLASFFLSIGLNGCLLFLLGSLGYSFTHTGLILTALSCVLLGAVFYFGMAIRLPLRLSASRWLRVAIYVFVFILLFYNGGLIEQVADSWWHMSLANKISIESSLSLNDGHLTGISERYYPPLWHGNLALVNALSGVDIPVIWNSVTAWVAVLKVMGFYLLSYSLCKDRAISTLAAVFFIVLPGLGDSYLRVSAWPSHVAYSALFCCFYVVFHIFDRTSQLKGGGFSTSVALLKNHKGSLASMLVLLVLVWFTHKVELIWFAIGVLAYFSGLSLHRLWSPSGFTEANPVWRDSYLIAIVLLLGASVWFYLSKGADADIDLDRLLAYLFPILILGVLLLIECVSRFKLSYKRAAQVLTCILFLLIFCSIDYTHMASLFVPELALLTSGHHEYPVQALGWFGGSLALPSWHLQLREGLLYGGVFSVFASYVMAFLKPSRLSLFLASTSTLALLLCISPYLHQWFRDILSYHSSWRVAVIVFHPIVLAAGCVSLLKSVHFSSRGICASIALLSVLILVAFDSRQHFDGELIQLKRAHQSPQRNWNLFYDQRYVFADSSLRYQADLSAIRALITPGAIVFSDKATSYYLAASANVHIRNIHRHHGLYKHPDWRTFINSRHFCYMGQPDVKSGVMAFFEEQNESEASPIFIVINKDLSNRNLRYSCIWNRRELIMPHLNRFTNPVFQGEYMNVYRLKP